MVVHYNMEGFAKFALIGPNKNNATSTPDYVNFFTDIFSEDTSYMNDIITRLLSTSKTSLLFLSSAYITNDLYLKYVSIDGYVDYLPSNIGF